MPKIEIEYNMKDRVHGFFEFLKERAMDPAHETVRDLVADFVDKFLIVEMKRLESEKDIRKAHIEIPKEVLLDPLRQLKQSMDEEFRKFLGEGPMPTVSPNSGSGTPAAPTQTQLDLGQKPAAKNSGNGHKKMKIRDLNDPERDVIRSEFIACGGQIDEDTCLPIKAKLASDVSIFQVTGFVSYLHKLIAEGAPNAPKIQDMPSYLAFLQKHRDLWARYNSDKYKALRAENVKKQVNTQ